MDSNAPGTWAYASVPSGALYAPDGSLQTPTHGRRSSIYRAQNSTLFSAFEEDGVALSDLPEEDEDDDDEERRVGRNGENVASGRSLVGTRGSEGEGERHPAYSGDDR